MGKVGELWVEFDARMDKFNRSITDAQKAMQRVGKKMEKVGKSLTKSVTLPIIAIGAASIKAFADFDKAITESLAIMGDVSDSMKKRMADVARTISEETTFSAKELAEAYYYLASAGMDAEQSVKALGDVARFAQAGAFDLATATDLLTDAQTALELSSKNAVKNQENLVRVSDVLVKANTLANASVQQFSEALTNRAAPALVQVNKSVEEGVAVLAAFADKGIKGQVAGMRFSMMLTNLETAARKNQDAFKKFNVSIYDSEGNMRKVADIIGDLEKALGNLPPKQRAAAMAQMGFNDRARQSIVTLLGSSEKIRQWEKDLKKAGGTTKQVADKQLKAFSNQMKLVWNSVVNLAASIGEQLGPALIGIVKAMKPLIKFAAGLVEKFSKLPGPVKTIAIAFFGLLAAVGPFLMIFGKILTILPSIILAVKFLAAKFLILKAVFLALTGPIGIVVAAIAALAVAAYLIVKNWKNIKAFFIGIWKGIEAAIGPILKKIFDVITYPFKKIVEFIKNIGPKIIKAITYPFKTAWKAVKDASIKVAKWIIDKFLWLGEQLAKIPLVKKFVKGFKEGMEEAKRSLAVITEVTEDGMKMAEAFVEAAKKTDIWTKANKLLGGALDKLGTKIEETEEKTGNLGKKLSEKLSPALVDAAGKVKLLKKPMGDLWGQFENLELAAESAGEAYLYMADDAEDAAESVYESISNIIPGFKIFTEKSQKAFDDVAGAAGKAAKTIEIHFKSMTEHILDFTRDLASGFAGIFTDMLNITESITYQMKEFDDSYYQSTLQNAEDAYEKKKQWILDNIIDEEARQQALAELEAAHQNEMDKIRADEDMARQMHADDELARQESLWNKVKTVFGQAVESMLQTWMTDFIQKILLSITEDIIPGLFSIAKEGAKAGIEAGKELSSGFSKALKAFDWGNLVSNIIGGAIGGAITAVLLGPKFTKMIRLQRDTNWWLKTIQHHIEVGTNQALYAIKDEALAGFYGKYDTMLNELYKIRDATQGTLKALTSQGTVYVDMFRSAIFESVGENIVGAVSSVKDDLGAGLANVAGRISDLDLSVHVDAPDLSGISEALGDIRGKVGSGIPTLQKGGVVKRETLAMLHPQEAVIPLDRKNEIGGDIHVHQTNYISAMDAIGVRDFMRKRGGPELIEMIRNKGTIRTQMKEALKI